MLLLKLPGKVLCVICSFPPHGPTHVEIKSCYCTSHSFFPVGSCCYSRSSFGNRGVLLFDVFLISPGHCSFSILSFYTSSCKRLRDQAAELRWLRRRGFTGLVLHTQAATTAWREVGPVPSRLAPLLLQVGKSTATTIISAQPPSHMILIKA